MPTPRTVPQLFTKGFFPSCIGDTDQSPAEYADFLVQGLTLEQVSNFFWSLESVKFTTDATIDVLYGSTPPVHYTASLSGDIVMSPIGGTGDFAAFDSYFNITNSGFYPDGFSMPVGTLSNVPQARVCNQPLGVPGWFWDFNNEGAGPITLDFQGYFWIRNDPSDATKYAIEWYMDYFATSSPVYVFSLIYSNVQPTGTGIILLNTGTFTIAGISFTYWCYIFGPSPTSYTSTGGNLSTSDELIFIYS